MNSEAMVMTLNALKGRIEAARKNREVCGRQVADAKHSFYITPDEDNRSTLAKSEEEYEVAMSGFRKANEAVRIFCYKSKSLNGKGRMVRL